MSTRFSLTRRGFLGALGAPVLLAQSAPPTPPASGNGYEKRDSTFGGYPAYVVLPRIAAPGNPWFWRGRFPDYQTRPALGLLSKGFHLAYLDLPNIFGNPQAVAAWEAFYDHVVLNFGLSPECRWRASAAAGSSSITGRRNMPTG